MRVLRVLAAVLENVGLPVGTYLGALAIGVPPVWALVLAAAASLVALGVRWAATREVTTLGLLVLGRFVAGVAVALVTGDARLEVVKDLAITGLIGVVALLTVRTRRPFIARIRRDLSGDREGFDRRWDADAAFRQVHRHMTTAWTVGLVGEAAVGVLVVYTLPLTAAVVVTNVLAPAVIVTLVALTERRVSAVPAPQQKPASAQPRRRVDRDREAGRVGPAGCGR